MNHGIFDSVMSLAFLESLLTIVVYSLSGAYRILNLISFVNPFDVYVIFDDMSLVLSVLL